MPHNTTLEKTDKLRRMFFHGCVSDIYTRLVRIRGTEVVL